MTITILNQVPEVVKATAPDMSDEFLPLQNPEYTRDSKVQFCMRGKI